MKVTQISYSPFDGVGQYSDSMHRKHLILAFADRPFGAKPEVWKQLREKSGQAAILACSTAGGILGPTLTITTLWAQWPSSKDKNQARLDFRRKFS